jgi:tRNA-Thr(GGU) m(6)t(6)A37 methyltransferase TsaA
MKSPNHFSLDPIGVVRSRFTRPEDVPIQPVYANEESATIEVFERYAEGLQDLAGFERIWLLYWFHQAPEARLRVVPFRDTEERGVFATRAPCRPNAIGMSAVRLLSIEDRMLHVAGADILDGTPLLDIKPYVPKFDAFTGVQAGWFDTSNENRTRADRRFAIESEEAREGEQ